MRVRLGLELLNLKNNYEPLLISKLTENLLEQPEPRSSPQPVTFRKVERLAGEK